MKNLFLSTNQKQNYLKSFKELDMQKELKFLLEKMYPNDSIYVLQGTQEYGKDIVIRLNEPVGTRYISIVVKMGDISGKARDSTLATIQNQIEQSFGKDFFIPDELGSKKINETYVFLLGAFSNNAQENIKIFIHNHFPGRVKLFDIHKIESYFTKYYPEIYSGASGHEAIANKIKKLDDSLLAKDRFIANAFIEPNIKKFNDHPSKKISLAGLNSKGLIQKRILQGLYGTNESMDETISSLFRKKRKILIEGDAGSGKSVYAIKLAQKLMLKAISSLEEKKSKNRTNIEIEVPILINANDIKNGDFDLYLKSYYEDCTFTLKPKVIIVDGLDEVNKERRLEIINHFDHYSNNNDTSIIFTCRKNYNLFSNLIGFDRCEIRPFEISQAINYVKNLVTENEILLESIIKGLEQIKNQIPFYPLAISLLVDIVKQHNEVPASISELYTRYINLALGEKDLSKGIETLFEYKIKRNFLSSLAYNIFYKNNILIINYETFREFTEHYVKERGYISS